MIQVCVEHQASALTVMLPAPAAEHACSWYAVLAAAAID